MNREVVIQCDEYTLERLLEAKRATLRVFIGERDERTWTPIDLFAIKMDNNLDGPWPEWTESASSELEKLDQGDPRLPAVAQESNGAD